MKNVSKEQIYTTNIRESLSFVVMLAFQDIIGDIFPQITKEKGITQA